MRNDLPLIVGITGASGVIYGVKLLSTLKAMNIKSILVLSQAAITTLHYETNFTYKEVVNLADEYYSNDDIGAAIASGGFLTLGMVIVPCSIKTLSAVAHSYSHNLIARAADVCLKERRKLVLAVRETPFHLGHLKLMEQATLNGAVIMPPIPEFYTKPKTLDDLVNASVSKILDLFGISNDLSPRWKQSVRDNNNNYHSKS